VRVVRGKGASGFARADGEDPGPTRRTEGCFARASRLRDQAALRTRSNMYAHPPPMFGPLPSFVPARSVAARARSFQHSDAASSSQNAKRSSPPPTPTPPVASWSRSCSSVTAAMAASSTFLTMDFLASPPSASREVRTCMRRFGCIYADSPSRPVVRTKLDSDLKPVAAKSLTVSVRCYETRLGRLGSVQSMKCLVEHSQVLWSSSKTERRPSTAPSPGAPSCPAYTDLGEFEAAFRITLPVNVGGHSTVTFPDYRVCWKVEAGQCTTRLSRAVRTNAPVLQSSSTSQSPEWASDKSSSLSSPSSGTMSLFRCSGR
jgi:hypothetical protein